MHLLNLLGYATIKNQSKLEAMHPLNPTQTWSTMPSIRWQMSTNSWLSDSSNIIKVNFSKIWLTHNCWMLLQSPRLGPQMTFKKQKCPIPITPSSWLSIQNWFFQAVRHSLIWLVGLMLIGPTMRKLQMQTMTMTKKEVMMHWRTMIWTLTWAKKRGWRRGWCIWLFYPRASIYACIIDCQLLYSIMSLFAFKITWIIRTMRETDWEILSWHFGCRDRNNLSLITP